MEHKMGVIRTLKHRANTIITKEEDKEEEVQHIKKVFSIANYSKWAWQAPERRKLNPHPNQRDHIRPKGHVTIPYVQGITEPISRLIGKAGVTAYTQPHTIIRKLLVTPKKTEISRRQMRGSIPSYMSRLWCAICRRNRKSTETSHKRT